MRRKRGGSQVQVYRGQRWKYMSILNLNFLEPYIQDRETSSSDRRLCDEDVNVEALLQSLVTPAEVV